MYCLKDWVWERKLFSPVSISPWDFLCNNTDEDKDGDEYDDIKEEQQVDNFVDEHEWKEEIDEEERLWSEMKNLIFYSLNNKRCGMYIFYTKFDWHQELKTSQNIQIETSLSFIECGEDWTNGNMNHHRETRNEDY
jgi:hypothetical protein